MQGRGQQTLSRLPSRLTRIAGRLVGAAWAVVVSLWVVWPRSMDAVHPAFVDLVRLMADVPYWLLSLAALASALGALAGAVVVVLLYARGAPRWPRRVVLPLAAVVLGAVGALVILLGWTHPRL